jgi:hypothetical protein
MKYIENDKVYGKKQWNYEIYNLYLTAWYARG